LNDNEKIDNKMDEDVDNEFNGYKSYNSNDARETSLGRYFFYSMSEARNEEQNEERNNERSEEGNIRINSSILTKGRCFWQGAKCDLVDDVGVFIANGCVITCDP
jgi:acetyltransferase-like isoleucine patch superfamily enzyme